MDLQNTSNIQEKNEIPENEKLKYTNTGKRTFVIGAIMLGISAILTGGLYGYNYKLSKDIDSLNESISVAEKNIQELLANKEVHAYKIFTENKASFDKLERHSRIGDMVTYLSETMNKADLKFENVSISDGNIKITGLADNPTNFKASYSKIYDFVKNHNESIKKQEMFNSKKQASENNAKVEEGKKEALQYRLKEILDYTSKEEGVDAIEFPLEIQVQ